MLFFARLFMLVWIAFFFLELWMYLCFQLWWHFVQHAKYKCEILRTIRLNVKLECDKCDCFAKLDCWSMVLCVCACLFHCTTFICANENEYSFFSCFCLHSYRAHLRLLRASQKRQTNKVNSDKTLEWQMGNSPNFSDPDQSCNPLHLYVLCLHLRRSSSDEKKIVANSFYNQLLLFTFVLGGFFCICRFCWWCCCCCLVVGWYSILLLDLIPLYPRNRKWCQNQTEIKRVKLICNKYTHSQPQTHTCSSCVWINCAMYLCYELFIRLLFFRMSIYFNAKVMSKFIYLRQKLFT